MKTKQEMIQNANDQLVSIIIESEKLAWWHIWFRTKKAIRVGHKLRKRINRASALHTLSFSDDVKELEKTLKRGDLVYNSRWNTWHNVLYCNQ